LARGNAASAMAIHSHACKLPAQPPSYQGKHHESRQICRIQSCLVHDRSAHIRVPDLHSGGSTPNRWRETAQMGLSSSIGNLPGTVPCVRKHSCSCAQSIDGPRLVTISRGFLL
jgi:hypothetical protein